MNRVKILDLVLCAIFAALSAILSQIMVPIGIIPINLTHLSIFISAGLLGYKYGTISQAIFVLLGAMGAPVFAGFNGGIGVIVGPKGGFIIGYIVCALIVGFILEHFEGSVKNIAFSMALGLIINYLFGITWFMYITKMSLVQALFICVVPFLVGDALKIALSAVVVKRLKLVLYRA